MPFSHITGNEPVKKYLTRMVENNAVAHSLLFAGKDNTKDLFAQAFAGMLLNDFGESGAKIVHPDFQECRPEGKIGMHSIDALRRLNDEVYITPHKAKRKVFIVYDADRMLPSSANALLKTFEEPPSWSIIILLAGNPEAMLPTILSRCRMIRFTAAKNLQASKEPLYEAMICLLAKGKMNSYGQLMEEAASLSLQLENNRKVVEEEVRVNIVKNALHDLTSVQKHSIDKEVEGVVALHAARDLNAILYAVQAWYRDIRLLQLNGDPAYLLNSEYRKDLDVAVQAGAGAPSVEALQQVLGQAKLAFERSTPIAHILENLFLKIQL